MDVCVVGGGIVGTALACALRASPRTSHLSVLLADRAPLPSSAWQDSLPDQPEPRVSALTPSSARLLRDVGAWDRVAAARACPFVAMQVWDARAPGHVRYDAAEIGASELGHVVENRVVHTALAEAAERLGVRVSPPASLARLRLGDRPGALAEADFADDPDARVDAPPDRTVRARLIVGADGARSRARQLANLRAPGWNYGLKAAVGTVDTDAPHHVAYQRFLPEGPLALLPVADGAKSNVVWTTTPEEADRLVGLPHDAFAAEVHDALHGLGRYRYDGEDDGKDGDVAERSSSADPRLSSDPFASWWAMQDALVSRVLTPATRAAVHLSAAVDRAGGLGSGAGVVGGPAFEPPPAVVGSSGARGAFPLAARVAGRYAIPRLALVGDAAHQVHPLGGQGVNLGLRDARLLVDALGRAAELGGDVGSATALAAYERDATRENAPMMAALDGLQRLFAAEAPIVAWARGAGLAGVNALGPLRRRIARYAMGGIM